MLKNLDRYIGNSVTFFAVAAYFELFKFIVIPYSIRMMSQVIACGLMLMLIILRLIYQPERLAKMNFAGPVLILILGAIPSYFIAQSFHNQSFLVSAMANHIIWFYLLYFFVHVYNISVKYVIRMIVFVGLLAVLLYYIQYALYPTMVLDIGYLEGRGTIRLFVAGMLCTQMAYFYFLNRFFENNRFLDLLLSLGSLSIFILQGTRQMLFALILLTLVNLFFSKRVKGRMLKTGIFILASVAMVLIFWNIFIELTRVTTSQASDLGGGIRLKALKFFLTSFQPDEWSYIFGNSFAGSGSIYNQKMTLYAYKYGFYLNDIGLMGDYIRYGVLFVLAGIYMLIKSVLFKVSPEYRYLKYYIVMQFFTLATAEGIFGGVDIILILILYVFDVDRANRLHNVTINNLNQLKTT